MATKKAVPQAISDYLAAIGRKGGQAEVKKGFAKMSDERRAEIAKNAAAKRWGNKTADAKKAVQKSGAKKAADR